MNLIIDKRIGHNQREMMNLLCKKLHQNIMGKLTEIMKRVHRLIFTFP